MNLLTITWDMGRGLDLGFFTLRYYSLLFAAGFVLGYMLMKRIFKKEGIPIEKLDTLLTYVVVATILGARLGHVFFYQWDYYSQHPDEILKVWEGGLASHGAVIGIIIAIIIYSRKVLKRPTLWMLDRLVITIALAGALIRLGNWFNSEIYGAMANSSMETVFTNPTRERLMNWDEQIASIHFEQTNTTEITDTLILPIYDMQILYDNTRPINKEQVENRIEEDVRRYLYSFEKEEKNILITPGTRVRWDEQVENMAHVEVVGIPRHPTQIYEAIGYFLIFLILYRIFLNASLAERKGFIFGMFLVLIFGFRFVIEYWKENQVSAEEGLTFNIGQYLSIPCVLAGLYFIFTAKPYRHE